MDPGHAAGPFPGIVSLDDEHDDIGAVSVAQGVDLVQVAVAGTCQPMEIVKDVCGALGVAHLELVDEAQAGPNVGVAVDPLGIVERLLDPRIHVSRRPPGTRGVGDHDVDRLSGIRGSGRGLPRGSGRLELPSEDARIFRPVSPQPVHVVSEDGGESFAERAQPVVLVPLLDPSVHVLPVNDHGHFRVCFLVAAMNARKALVAVLDDDVGENQEGSRIVAGTRGEGERQRVCAQHRARCAVADLDVGGQRVGTDRLQGGGARFGENRIGASGSAHSGVVGGEDDERRRLLTAVRVSSGDEEEREERGNNDASERVSEIPRFRRRLHGLGVPAFGGIESLAVPTGK